MAESALVLTKPQTQLSPEAAWLDGQQGQHGMRGRTREQFQPSRLRPSSKSSRQIPSAGFPLIPDLVEEGTVKASHRLQLGDQDRALAFHPR